MDTFQRILTRTSNSPNANIGTSQPLLSMTPLPSAIHLPISTGSHPSPSISHTSLVQKIAARFVPSSTVSHHNETDHADGDCTPRSKGGNPLHRQQLFAETIQRIDHKPVYSESQKYKSGAQMSHKEGSQSAVGVLVLLWLINQRDVLQYLSQMRSLLHQDKQHMLKSQETVHSQLVTLGEQLTRLQSSVNDQRQQITTEKESIKRLLTIFGLVQLVVMVTMLSWPNKTVLNIYSYCFRHLKKSVVNPSLSLLRQVKRLPGILTHEIPDVFEYVRNLWTFWAR